MENDKIIELLMDFQEWAMRKEGYSPFPRVIFKERALAYVNDKELIKKELEEGLGKTKFATTHLDDAVEVMGTGDIPKRAIESPSEYICTLPKYSACAWSLAENRCKALSSCPYKKGGVA